VGSGIEKSILEYAEFLKSKIGFKGKIKFDKSKPDGTPRKIVDISVAKSYGWKPQFSLLDGFNLTLDNFIKNFK